MVEIAEVGYVLMSSLSVFLIALLERDLTQKQIRTVNRSFVKLLVWNIKVAFESQFSMWQNKLLHTSLRSLYTACSPVRRYLYLCAQNQSPSLVTSSLELESASDIAVFQNQAFWTRNVSNQVAWSAVFFIP